MASWERNFEPLLRNKLFKYPVNGALRYISESELPDVAESIPLLLMRGGGGDGYLLRPAAFPLPLGAVSLAIELRILALSPLAEDDAPDLCPSLEDVGANGP